MHFKLVLEKLLSAFKDQNIRYALMGGFAMGLWGAGRTTVDKEMKISQQASKEIMELSESESLKKDMDALRRQRHNPFIKNGMVDIDAYIEFVTQFNEFINHEPKPFRRIIEKDMRL